MKKITIYAYNSNGLSRTKLRSVVNTFLESVGMTTSEHAKGLLERTSKKKGFWNLNKDARTWVEFYPNEMTDGGFFYPEFSGFDWLLRVRFLDDGSVPERTLTFINKLLAAVATPNVVVHESDHDEE